ncbi:MAG: two-component regulator propeller domain-containing protein [Bacteroidota bacterium]
MRRLFLILLSFLSVSGGYTQTHNFKVYSIDEGIPQSQVHTIHQDKKGFLWFGTDGGGLTLYDGRQFKSYTTTEGLSNDLVYMIAEDKDEKLWIATAKGLSIFQNKKFLPLPDALKPLQELMLRAVTIDSKGRILFGTNKGAFIYDGKSLTEMEALKGKFVYGIYEDPQGCLWLGTNGSGAYKLKEGKTEHYTTESGLGSNIVSAFYSNKQGGLLIGTESGLYEEGVEGFSRFPLPAPENSKQNVRYIAEDNAGNIWVCTWDCGVYRIDTGTRSAVRYGKNQGLTVEGVYCFLQDTEGNCWLGTDGAGAVMLGKQTFTSLRAQNGLPDEMVLSMCQTRDGAWWLGHDNGASYYDGKTTTLFTSRNGLSDDKVWDIMEDKDGNIWIATYGHGVFRYSSGKFINLNEKSGLSSNNVRAVFQDSKGRIWIGTANGLNLYNGKGFRIFGVAEGLSSQRILGFYEDKKGVLWIGTSAGGIVRVRESGNDFSFQSFTDKEGLADNVVLCMTEDSEGNVWTANFGGISKLNPATGEIKKITKMDGLASNTVYALAFADEAHLLIGTNSGIDKLDIGEYNRTGKVSLKHFGKEEGFAGLECNTNSVLKTADGRIWFGTVKGVFIYDPAQDKPNPVKPLTHLVGLRLFFEHFDFSLFADSAAPASLLPPHFTFPHHRNHLTFDFAGLSYMIPQHVRYQYMLEGFDQDWLSPVSENFATYSNIPPGRYTFKVRSCNNDGIWSETPATLSFTVLPPFWQTWWFRTLVLASLVFGVYLFFQWRTRRLRARQKYLQEQVDLKTKELREEKELVEEQSKIIEKKNHSITSSIKYARRIQDSILPVKEKLNELIPESFIFFKPKDIVSGDFYWFARQNGTTMVATVDCTGHGVPGAFMSLIGNNLLNDLVNNQKITDPKVILEKMHAGVVQALKKEEQESGTVDGMDITLCCLHQKDSILEFASTGRPLILIRGNELKKYKVGRHPVGLVAKKEIRFEKETLQLQPNDTFYIFTDGYCDQFGGPDDDKYLDSNFEKLLLKIQGQNMYEQAGTLESEIEKWKGERQQLDDILVIGVKN